MKREKLLDYSLSLLLCGLVSAEGSLAHAATPSTMIACANTTSGSVVVRRRCTKAERQVSVFDLVAQGPVGPRGEIGPQGPKGDVGIQGLPGVSGATGPVGPVGPQGQRGDTGAQGLVGPQGPMGPQGAVGPRGESAFDSIPAGRSVYGVLAADYYASAANSTWSTSASLPGVAPALFGNELTEVKNNTEVDNECGGGTCLHEEELVYSDHCTGTYQAPSAPPGWICIYPVTVTNVIGVRGLSVPSGSGKYGFDLRWRAPAVGATSIRAVWAYTAP